MVGPEVPAAVGGGRLKKKVVRRLVEKRLVENASHALRCSCCVVEVHAHSVWCANKRAAASASIVQALRNTEAEFAPEKSS